MVVLSFLSYTLFLAYVLIGIYAYHKAPGRYHTHLFFVSALILAWWAFCASFIYLPGTSLLNLRTWFRLSLPAYMLIPVLILHFIFILTGHKSFLDKRWPILLFYLPAVVLISLGYLDRLSFITRDISQGWQIRVVTESLFYLVYVLYATAYQIISLVLLFRWRKTSKSRKLALQSRTLIISLILTQLMGLVWDIILPFSGVMSYYHLGHLIWGLVLAGTWMAIHYYHLLKSPTFINSGFIASRITEMLMVLDEKGKIILSNDRLHQTLGIAESALIGERISSVIADKAIIPRLMEKLIGPNPTPDFECSFLSSSGQEIPVLVSASRHMDRFGDLVGFTFIAQDLRFQKEMESEIEERKRWEVEVRYAHHELKLKHKELELEQNKLKLKNEMIDIELGMARKIQTELIPSHSPIPEKLAFFYKPMEKVGGDFYDFIEFPGNSLIGIFLSDVSGHGVPAAFITSMIKSHNLQHGRNFTNPGDFLHSLNDFLLNKTGENFITAFYGIFNPDTGDFYFSNAGHDSPYLIKRNTVQPLSVEGRGIPLGILSRQELAHMSKSYTSQHIHLAKKNKLFLYTDGLTETSNIYDEERSFEAQGMFEAIEKYRDLKPQIFVQKMFEQLSDFRQSKSFEDDICMLCLEA